MTLIKKYTCNLCQEEEHESNLLCVYWDSTRKNDAGYFGTYILRQNLNESGKHVCLNCMEMIKSYSLTL